MRNNLHGLDSYAWRNNPQETLFKSQKDQTGCLQESQTPKSNLFSSIDENRKDNPIDSNIHSLFERSGQQECIFIVKNRLINAKNIITKLICPKYNITDFSLFYILKNIKLEKKGCVIY